MMHPLSSPLDILQHQATELSNDGWHLLLKNGKLNYSPHNKIVLSNN